MFGFIKVDFYTFMKNRLYGAKITTTGKLLYPVSYAMMGLLRQFQRTEVLIYEVVSILLKAAYEIEYTPSNIPNAYLNS